MIPVPSSPSPSPSPSPSWKPQLCLSTLGCAELSFGQTVALAAEHKLAAIEVRCLLGKTIEPANFPTLIPSDSDALTTMTQHRIQLCGLGTSVKLMNAQAEDIETLVKFARLAEKLQCPWLRVFDGGSMGETPTEQHLSSARALAAAWQSKRAELGLSANLMVETHDGLTSIAAIAKFRAELPEIAILWDSHHTWRAGESVSGYCAAAQSAIVHVHVKDSIDRPSARKPFTYCLPGLGEFPWPELGALMRQSEFPGKFSLEWERHWHPDLSPIQDALPLYREILQSG
jgi:sugar phosphate isomerase/epimerase